MPTVRQEIEELRAEVTRLTEVLHDTAWCAALLDNTYERGYRDGELAARGTQPRRATRTRPDYLRTVGDDTA